MAVVRLPRSTGQFEWGLSCKGCEMVWDNKRGRYEEEPTSDVCRDYERTYHARNLLEHLKKCEQSQQLWDYHKTAV